MPFLLLYDFELPGLRGIGHANCFSLSFCHSAKDSITFGFFFFSLASSVILIAVQFLSFSSFNFLDDLVGWL